MKEARLPVAERFYSIQGEGKTMGVPAVFCRFSGCTLMCGGQGTQFDGELHNGATWRCDTIETWMQGTLTPLSEILGDTEVEAIKNGAHLVLTGGEPLMHSAKLVEFIEYIKVNINSDVFVEVETSGTVAPSIELIDLVDQWNCSPKLSNSGNDKNVRFKPEVITLISSLPNTQFKFVINRLEDLSEIKRDYMPLIKAGQIWLMPAASDREELFLNSEVVSHYAMEYYWRFSSRLQVVNWDKTVGV